MGVIPFRGQASSLKHCLLGSVMAQTRDEVPYGTMAGLVWVRDVSVVEGMATEEEPLLGVTLHLLCPAPAPLVTPFLVIGDGELRVDDLAS